MGATSIEWCDHSVNPIRARIGGRVGHTCEKISAGCRNCYSSRLQPRFGLPQFQEQRREPVESFLDAKVLSSVLRRRKPTKFFWCDMTDMFGDWVSDEWIAACFGVMAATPQHTHQVLTKRIERAAAWFRSLAERATAADSLPVGICVTLASQLMGIESPAFMPALVATWPRWPLPSVWLGVSVENQEYADKRIPVLLGIPAAVRFLSVEPQLGPINLRGLIMSSRLPADCTCGHGHAFTRCPNYGSVSPTCHYIGCPCPGFARAIGEGIHLAIQGGESGPGARPFDVEWARNMRRQCSDTGTAYFYKQGGASHACDHSRKGGCLDCMPADLAVREFPR